MSSIFRILKSNINLTNDSIDTTTKLSTGTTTKFTDISTTPNPFVLNPQKESKKSKPKYKQSKIKSVETSVNPQELAVKESDQIKESDNVKESDQPLESDQLLKSVRPDTNTLNKHMYWEYGNSGLKKKSLNKIMGRNLAILYFLDKIFSCYNDLESNSLDELFNTTLPIIHKFGSNIISSIPNSNLEPNVQIQLDCGKISGTYKVEAVGFTTISNIKIQEKDLIKNKIPSFDNFIERLDNIKEILKITNILSLNKKFTYKSNCSNQEFDLMFINQNYKNIWDLFKQEDREKKLLRSNSNYAFYIKIYDFY
jgi:hypothetical protein